MNRRQVSSLLLSHTCRALIPRGVDDEDSGVERECILPIYPSGFFTTFPLAMALDPDSFFSKLAEAESHITEPAQTSTDAMAWSSHSKGGSTDTLPDFFLNSTSDHVHESEQPTRIPVATPASEPPLSRKPRAKTLPDLTFSLCFHSFTIPFVAPNLTGFKVAIVDFSETVRPHPLDLAARC